MHARLSPQLEWTPAQRTSFVLTDHIDYANGWVTPLPFNHGQLYLSPPDGPDGLEDFDDWLELLMTHEYTHVLHMDRATGAPRGVRYVLGRNVFTFPQLFQPSFLVEGLATYEETDAARGVGRGQSALSAMQMRAELARGVMPFDRLQMSGQVEWPAGVAPYLYGVHFYQFLEARYGRASVMNLVRNYGNNLIPFFVNGNLAKTLGKDTPTLWAEFDAYLRERYPAVGQAPAAVLQLSHDGYRTAAPTAAADGSVYWVRADHRRRPTLMRWRAGAEPEALLELNEVARLDWHPTAGLLIAQPEVCGLHELYFDLYRYDSTTEDLRRLTHCSRDRFAAWSPDGRQIVAVRTEAGQSRLLRLDATGRELEQLWIAHDGEILGELDWSPDGTTVVAARWQGGAWDLAAFDLGARRWRALTDDAAVDAQPQFSVDGASVLFSSDHGGKYDLRRLELASGRVSTLTDAATGAFAPSEAPDGDVFYLGYGPTGYDLFRLPAAERRADPLPAAPPKVAARNDVAPPNALPQNAPRSYRPWSSLMPRSWWPVLTITEDSAQYGAATWGSDALDLHSYLASLSYETESASAVGGISYAYDLRYAVSATRTLYHDVDDSGALERLERDDQLDLIASFPWLWVQRTLGLHFGAGYRFETDLAGLGTLPPRPDRTDALVGAAFTWDDSDSLPRSVSRSRGREIRLIAETSDGFDTDYAGAVYQLDWREFVGLPGEHVLALRYLRGEADAAARPFRLGGVTPSQPNLLGAIGLFGERDYALRGYPEGVARLTGDAMELASVEWRLPIARPERAWRRPPFGLHQVAGALFYEVGEVTAGSAPTEQARGFGVEVVTDVNLFYFVNLRLRLGAARGLDAGGGDRGYLTLSAPF